MLDERFMRMAINLALRASGLTSPNPAVGAVIVKNGKVVARGYHKKAGGAHAEAEAIGNRDLLDATLYVTLEPCCHYGKTPPCTDAILRSGIKTVVVGTKDPNPAVAGKGIKILRRAGIEVITGVLEGECRALNVAYNKYIVKRVPYVTLKLAVSLDGRIATSTGDSRWITGIGARRLVHRMRSLSDAVMVGASTVVKDDPELTVRLVEGKSPVRVVVDSRFKAPLESRVFKKAGGAIVFVTRDAPRKKIEKALESGIKVVAVPKSRQGVDLKRVVKELGRLQVTSLLVEGGGTLAASLLKSGLVDRVCLFMAPLIIGAEGTGAVAGLGIKKVSGALKLKEVAVKTVGHDILVEGRL